MNSIENICMIRALIFANALS